MSSSSSPIELTILSVKPQDSHVHHAASHVYVLEKKTKEKKEKKLTNTKEKWKKLFFLP